jgi:hypothetical protein
MLARPPMEVSVRVAALLWSLLLAPVRFLVRILDRLVAVLDTSEVAQMEGAQRLRRLLAVITFVLAIILAVRSTRAGGIVSPAAVLAVVLAIALYTNRGGRFVRDWLPVVLAFFSYALVAKAVPDLGLQVHFTPQIEAERLLHGGTLPTIWLQDHLYAGATGVLEVFSLLMYISHFLAPVLLACLIWVFWPGRGFNDLLFGILLVSFLGEITFLLAPTAPPWLAADQGLIPPVDPIIKNALSDLGLNELASLKGDSDAYNVVAALPSLHAAWPVIGLLVIRKYRLPGWLFGAQVAVTLGVFFAIVYTGEHYFVDALLGVLYALGAWWLLQRILGPEARPVVHQQPLALPELAPPVPALLPAQHAEERP